MGAPELQALVSAVLMPFDEKTLQRRVAGPHDIRMDGMYDVVLRAPGTAVMDIGCNRGQVGFEFAVNGARLVHGCDHFAEGIWAAKQWFMDMRNVESQFEVVDLSTGISALAPFRGQRYDIMLLLATYHKLKRIMPPQALTELVQHLAKRTSQYFCWRATSEKFQENEQEMAALDRDLGAVDFQRIHTSYISKCLGVAAIWSR